MSEPLQLPGVSLRRGDHVCGFYYGEDERDAMLLPFLRGALRTGDKCVAVVDSVEPVQVASRLMPELDIDECLASGQLEMYDSHETYLRSGSFEPEEMIRFWEDRAQATKDENRYSFAWVVGEMSWLDRVTPERERLVRYETWANAFAASFPQAVLCLYDLRRLGGGVMLDILKTHPRVLLGGLLFENPHHLSDDEFAAARA